MLRHWICGRIFHQQGGILSRRCSLDHSLQIFFCSILRTFSLSSYLLCLSFFRWSFWGLRRGILRIGYHFWNHGYKLGKRGCWLVGGLKTMKQFVWYFCQKSRSYSFQLDLPAGILNTRADFSFVRQISNTLPYSFDRTLIFPYLLQVEMLNKLLRTLLLNPKNESGEAHASRFPLWKDSLKNQSFSSQFRLHHSYLKANTIFPTILTPYPSNQNHILYLCNFFLFWQLRNRIAISILLRLSHSMRV